MERRLKENVEQSKILLEDQDTHLLGTNILSFCDWNVFFLWIKKRFMKISFIFTLNFMFRNVLLSSCLFLILSQRNQRFVLILKSFIFFYFLLDKIKKTVSTIEKLRKAEADFRYFNMLKKDNVFCFIEIIFFFLGKSAGQSWVNFRPGMTGWKNSWRSWLQKYLIYIFFYLYILFKELWASPPSGHSRDSDARCFGIFLWIELKLRPLINSLKGFWL